MTARIAENISYALFMGLILIFAFISGPFAQPIEDKAIACSSGQVTLSLTIGEDNERIRITVGECLQLPITATIADSENDSDMPVIWTANGYPMEHGADFATCRFAGYITWTPQDSDRGNHSLSCTVSYGIQRARQAISIEVVRRHIKFATDKPLITPEPEYTSGHTNTIYCNPLPLNIPQEIYIFDSNNTDAPITCYRLNALSMDTLADGRAAITVTGLQRSTRYGYYIAAQHPSHGGRTIYSDTVYSIQDFAPPYQVIEVNAVISDLGELIVSWNGVNDDLTHVSYYELYRRRKSGDFILLGTVPAMYGNDDRATRYSFSDSVIKGTGAAPLVAVQYMVRAIDGAGNGNDGVYSDLVSLPDINSRFTGRPDPSDSTGTGTAANTTAR